MTLMLPAPPERPEIVIGLVYAAGTNMEPVSSALSSALREVGYREEPIRLSQMLEDLFPLEQPIRTTPFEDRLNDLMSAGNLWREKMRRGDALAILAITRIRALRLQIDPTQEGMAVRPFNNCAFVIRSLKHPEEVKTLREVYGPSFFLLSVHEAKQTRIDNLARQIAGSHNSVEITRSESKAMELVDRDDAEDGKRMGQQVRETFWQGDAFIRVEDANGLEKQLRHIIQTWFGHPFHTPTRDEYLMFNAQAAAYRSASLGRQVGAVIARQDGSIVASGTNEVPKAGGGTYWQEDTFDRRDHVRGRDSSDEMRYELLGDIMDRLQRNGWIHPDKEHTKINEMVRDLLEGDPPVMKGAVFASLTEFQRPVHAEMSALTDAARNGTATGGCSIFVTTFPCHGCTRHIIASGIKRVVYIEPYAKSLALHMHEDAIEVDKDHYNETKVHFEPFVGLAPRRYLELFVMIKRKENNGELVKWDPAIAVPRLGGWSHLLTIENENTLIVKSREALQKAGLE